MFASASLEYVFRCEILYYKVTKIDNEITADHYYFADTSHTTLYQVRLRSAVQVVVFDSLLHNVSLIISICGAIAARIRGHN